MSDLTEPRQTDAAKPFAVRVMVFLFSLVASAAVLLIGIRFVTARVEYLRYSAELPQRRTQVETLMRERADLLLHWLEEFVATRPTQEAKTEAALAARQARSRVTELRPDLPADAPGAGRSLDQSFLFDDKQRSHLTGEMRRTLQAVRDSRLMFTDEFAYVVRQEDALRRFKRELFEPDAHARGFLQPRLKLLQELDEKITTAQHNYDQVAMALNLTAEQLKRWSFGIAPTAPEAPIFADGIRKP